MNPPANRPPRCRSFTDRAAPACALALVACACSASAALAKLPSPQNSTVPSHINLVGSSAAGIDPCGEFTVVVKNLANDPQWGTLVILDFSQATDVRLATSPVETGAFEDCPTRTIRAESDINGVVKFHIVGASNGGAPSSFAPNVNVYADGVPMGTISFGTFDLDGANGVGGADDSRWIDDFGSGTNPARSDYDGDGVVGGADMSLWLDAFGSTASSQSGAAYCP